MMLIFLFFTRSKGVFTLHHPQFEHSKNGWIVCIKRQYYNWASGRH